MGRFFILVSIISTVAYGLPASAGAKGGGSLECHRAEDYTTEWFLDNAKEKFRHRPLKNNALFYSAGMSQAAQKIANESKLITIWDIWPCYLYNHLNHSGNPLRCIHGEDEERQYFFSEMSRAFAKMAQNFSTVLHSCENYGQPPSNGIWGMVEFPTLQQGGVVDFLEKINENKTLSEIFWRRTRKYVASLWDTFVGHDIDTHGAELKRRGHINRPKRKSPPPLPPGFHGTCMSSKQLDFFDNVGW